MGAAFPGLDTLLPRSSGPGRAEPAAASRCHTTAISGIPGVPRSSSSWERGFLFCSELGELVLVLLACQHPQKVESPKPAVTSTRRAQGCHRSYWRKSALLCHHLSAHTKDFLPSILLWKPTHGYSSSLCLAGSSQWHMAGGNLRFPGTKQGSAGHGWELTECREAPVAGGEGGALCNQHGLWLTYGNNLHPRTVLFIASSL